MYVGICALVYPPTLFDKLREASTQFLSDPGKPGVRSLGPYVRHSLPPRHFADLTDMTLADEDTNSILTDNVNAMQVMQTGDQCKFATIASGASWLPNLQPIQMVPSDGKI